ncbi:hypothetical protein NIES4075_41200 [Tolypothrix sp. NIES-4075]|uniref:hypothetical protein n=1 Tax=Tolypothrix sp. NIES-4075 TaxID=2005459 RepID=UPI000B5C4101|nr:hypothetical protein [Tolypothrix sp. NIES-4075]GAX43108.1 hypothetical protein NIES4075_41200 [Tolypothrix sp. NIES-4075]
MLRRSLFACALMLASVVGFASNAKAAPVTGDVNQPVKFTATVPTSCTLAPGSTADGVLGVNGTNTVLSSSIPGGTAAKLTVNCNNGTLKVAAPTFTSSTATTPTTFAAANLKATVTIGTKTADSLGATIALTNTDTDANVNMEATSATAIAPGTYN